MAINLVSLDGLIVLTKVGVPSDLIAQMQASDPPIKVQVKNKKLSILLGTETVWEMETATSELIALSQGKMTSVKKSCWCVDLTAGLTKALSAATVVPPTNKPVGVAAGTVTPAPVMPVAGQNSSVSMSAVTAAPAGVVTAVQPWSPVPEGEMSSAARVKLANADRLYQPVFGTSEGSRYFLVAGSKKIKVAARYRDTTLSVRVEGQLAGAITALKAIGFKPSDKGHLSMHFEVPDQGVAAKTLGAVLLAAGQPFETPLPQLAKIAGKGA